MHKKEKVRSYHKLAQLCIALILLCSSLAACSTYNISDSDRTEITEATQTTEEIKQEVEKKKETSEIPCEVDDCTKTGQYSIEGFSGEMEYYCYTHYNEIQDMLADLLDDTIICEKDGCRREGIYAIEGFSGKMEYYCYAHYSDIQDMIDSLLNEPSYGECDNCGRPAEYEWDENTVYCEACLESLLNYIYNN